MDKLVEQRLENIFTINSDCYADGTDATMAMTKERFVEVVKKILRGAKDMRPGYDLTEEEYKRAEDSLKQAMGEVH